MPTPPVVRARTCVWLDSKGRKQQELLNEIVVKDSGGNILTQGVLNSSTGKIVSLRGSNNAIFLLNRLNYFIKEYSINAF